jgi:hypothetical protein
LEVSVESFLCKPNYFSTTRNQDIPRGEFLIGTQECRLGTILRPRGSQTEWVDDKSVCPPYVCLEQIFLDDQIAGVGFFLGFLTSLFLRCCPFAMIVLLLWLKNSHNNMNRGKLGTKNRLMEKLFFYSQRV